MYKKRPFPTPQAAVLTKKICESAPSPSISLGTTNSEPTPRRVVTEFKTANDKSITVSEESLARAHSLVQTIESDAENIPAPPSTPVTPFQRLPPSRLGIPTTARLSLSENSVSTPAALCSTPASSRTPRTPATPLGTLDGYFPLCDLANYNGKHLRVVGYLEDDPFRTEKSSGLYVSTFTLRDDSNCSVQCDVWRRDGDDALANIETGVIVMIQARVKVIKGQITLTSTVKDVILVQPDMPEADRIRKFLQKGS